jgi:hypothetical protein
MCWYLKAFGVVLMAAAAAAATPGHPAHELEVLEQILVKLSTFHVSKRAKKNQVPFNLPLPQLDPNMVSESSSCVCESFTVLAEVVAAVKSAHDV